MKIIYGQIIVNVLAEEREINGPNEIALSDAFEEVKDTLEEDVLDGLQLRFPQFTFEFKTR